MEIFFFQEEAETYGVVIVDSYSILAAEGPPSLEEPQPVPSKHPSEPKPPLEPQPKENPQPGPSQHPSEPEPPLEEPQPGPSQHSSEPEPVEQENEVPQYADLFEEIRAGLRSKGSWKRFKCKDCIKLIEDQECQNLPQGCLRCLRRSCKTFQKMIVFFTNKNIGCSEAVRILIDNLKECNLYVQGLDTYAARLVQGDPSSDYLRRR